MAILHKIDPAGAKTEKTTSTAFAEGTWQIRRDVADAMLRLVRACLVTGTWMGLTQAKKAGSIKIQIRHKGVGTDDWFDSADAIHELAKEVEELVEDRALLPHLLTLPVADAPKGYRAPRPGSVDDYEQLSFA